MVAVGVIGGVRVVSNFRMMMHIWLRRYGLYTRHKGRQEGISDRGRS